MIFSGQENELTFKIKLNDFLEFSKAPQLVYDRKL